MKNKGKQENGALLSAQEVGKILRVSHNTVLRWLREGKIPALKLGKTWRVRPEVLDALLLGKKPPED